MTDFLFHRVTDKEKKEILNQTKEIINNFSKKLSIVKKQIPTQLIERNKMERKESKPEKVDNSFRKRVFENAPEKNEESIIAEKKSW